MRSGPAQVQAIHRHPVAGVSQQGPPGKNWSSPGSPLLGVLDNPQGDAILERPGRVLALELGPNADPGVRRERG